MMRRWSSCCRSAALADSDDERYKGTHTVTDATLPAVPPLTAEAYARAIARYSTTTDLRKLLTHDAALGGIPIRMLSARWMLEHFLAAGHERARLEHRQAIEREHGDAPFVSGGKLERALAEVESGKYEGVKCGGGPVQIAFPSLMAMSHMCAHALACKRPRACALRAHRHGRRHAH